MSKGLSVKVHNSIDDDLFMFKGAMGKGLQIKNNGTHIAFTAGTGSLVFLDLVAYLLRLNTGMLNSEK